MMGYFLAGEEPTNGSVVNPLLQTRLQLRIAIRRETPAESSLRASVVDNDEGVR